jgi:hypothetical protein
VGAIKLDRRVAYRFVLSDNGLAQMPYGQKHSKLVEDPASVSKELVSRIYEDILSESCVVFVGAGSTTERPYGNRESFYEKIRDIAKFPPGRPSFPELMQYYCDRIDGGHHNRLIREAVSRIELFCVRGEDNQLATMFTDSLAEIPYFNRFVTTNWDPFLERSLDVLVPMVEDRDLAFWDDHKRQVLKIHGCITRPYSIVATQSDYDRCMDLNPLVFNKLKDLMATKTFLFSGYSMRDPDFQIVWELIGSKLGHFGKTAYALDPKATDDQISHWKGRGIQIYKITDIMFARRLRARLEKERLIPSTEFLHFLQKQAHRITSLHIRMGQTSDSRLASAMYQDGLLHELSSVITSNTLGTKKKEDFEKSEGDAVKTLRRIKQDRDPIEIAYWAGRVEILERFNRRKRSPIPAYFHPYQLRPMTKLLKGKAL